MKLGSEMGKKLALVIRPIPMVGGGRAEAYYIGASGKETSVWVMSSSGPSDVSSKIMSAIRDAANAGVANVIFDLVNHRIISSEGLGFLVKQFHIIKGNGGAAVLANLNANLTGIIETTRLSEVFVLAGSVQEAVQYLGSIEGRSST